MKRRFRLRLYRDRKGGWRWTMYAGNGRKVANGGESYRRRIDAKRIADKLFPGMFDISQLGELK